MSTPAHQVVVVGGGYAGTIAANRLRSRDDVAVTIVNPRPVFVDRIRLHQFTAGTGQAQVDYDTLLGEGVRLVVDDVTRIDPATRTLHLASGGTLPYDHVVYAVGSTGAIPLSVPGAAVHALSVAELESARRLRTRLGELAPSDRVTVVGGGLTGVEVAAELAEQGRPVTLIGDLAPSLSVGARRSATRWLARHGVVLVDGQVAEVLPDAVVLADRSTHRGALTIWAAGFGVPGLAAASGLRTDDLGRLLTDETLTSVDDERIVAAGDAAAPSGQPLRMSCQAAGPLGAQAADTVLSRIAGEEPAVINQAFVGSCVSLGRGGGVRQFATKDDRARELYFGGRVAAVYKEFTCKVALAKIRLEARRPGSLPWIKGGTRATAAQRV
ncbi:FAD-dependent oxidoreductase [Actinophytocola xinjiangensis]|uniref:FAD-dependent oxidoreductase n=1 Tax=Actinophytocola xinjiangensis TaxID=485602 RepID=A0A7Z1AUR1_9PSEU|nr:FAD-dependent oxidoreductase [Actinophytocola xinjiangensis]OLF04811.1 FAD-dependent oxidoreductase [Actinophytocola xinjiangensis]